MPVSEDKSEKLVFGDFTLDLRRRALFRGAERIRLTAKPLDVLSFLAQNSGTTVSKQELMDAVWKDTFVSEDNLTQAILKIRRVLGDEKESPQYIQTIPRTGYRFVCPVTPPDATPDMVRSEAIAHPFPTRPLFSHWRYVTGFMLALLGGVLIWWTWHSGREQDNGTEGAEYTSFSPRRIPLPINSATKPTFAPDGSHFLFVGYRRERPGIGDLYIASLADQEVKQITDGADPRGDHPVFTPEGTEVVFSRWRNGDDGTRWPDLWIGPANGGNLRILVGQASGAGYSPDGRWLAYTKHLPGGKALWISPRTDLDQHREISPLGFNPRWSPDGRWIAFTTSNPEGGLGEVWITSMDLSTRKRLTASPSQMYGISWTSDGASVIFSSIQSGEFHLTRIPIDGGPAAVLTTGVGSCLSPSVSSNGRVLLFSHVDPSRNLYYAKSAEGDAAIEITRGQYHDWPVLSPDGNWVASSVQTPGFDNMLYITDTSSGTLRKVSDKPASCPAWLDAEKVAYLSEISTAGMEVRVADVSGGANRTLCRFSDHATSLAIHPSGRQIAVVLNAVTGRQSIVIRSLVDGRDTVLAEGGEYEHLRWIPGENSISWSGPLKSAGAQSDGIWIAEVGGAGPKRLVPDGNSPVWSEDGNNVYYSRMGDYSGLWRFNRQRKDSVRIRTWTETDLFDVCGGRLIFARVSSDTHVFSTPLNARSK